jgi:hypothetical protein
MRTGHAPATSRSTPPSARGRSTTPRNFGVR